MLALAVPAVCAGTASAGAAAGGARPRHVTGFPGRPGGADRLSRRRRRPGRHCIGRRRPVRGAGRRPDQDGVFAERELRGSSHRQRAQPPLPGALLPGERQERVADHRHLGRDAPVPPRVRAVRAVQRRGELPRPSRARDPAARRPRSARPGRTSAPTTRSATRAPPRWSARPASRPTTPATRAWPGSSLAWARGTPPGPTGRSSTPRPARLR